MRYTSTLTASGQITIPKALRELAGIKKSEKLTLTYNAETGHICLEKPYTIDNMLSDLSKIRANFSKETKSIIKANAGKTASELFDQAWNSPEEIVRREEKYSV